MSTAITPSFVDSEHDQALLRFTLGLEDVECLLEPEQLARRLAVLDELDAIIGDAELEMAECVECSRSMAQARKLGSRLEAANETLYRVARSEIVRYGRSPLVHRWMRELTKGEAYPGLGLDSLDEIVSGVLPLRAPAEGGGLQSSEMTPYQPTPARHILDLIAACRLADGDTLVDLGSGLGHVPLMVSILTGVRSVGVEIQREYVLSAQETAHDLNLSNVRFIANLSNVRFIAEDARTTDLSIGTVFYLFTPFTGSILRDVLRRLREQSQEKRIRVCSLGPCTRIVQNEAWLTADGQTDTDRIAVFHSR